MEAVKSRSELPAEYKWRLEDMYENDGAWEKDFERLSSMLDGLAAHSGKLNTVSGFKIAMDEIMCAQKIAERLYVYARMRRDEDNGSSVYQALADRAHSLSVKLSSATSFVAPELSRVPDEELRSWAGQPGMEDYAHYLDDIIRHKKHILSEPEEKLLALAGEVTTAAGNAFTMLNNADLRFDSVILPDGETVEITHGRFRGLIEHKDRNVRHDAFTKLYKKYAENENTLAALLSANIKKDIFYMRARKYPSAREMALFGGNVPLSVYDSLIDTVRNSLPALWRYLSLKKKALGLDELHLYDVYASLFPDVDIQMDYEKAKQTVREGLAPLGPEYAKLLDEAFSQGWIDVYENRGKTSGAYSWGAYGVHPYVLLNYQGRLDDVFTLTHELGHAMHSYYSDKNQPFINAGYKIFVAEVASTVNEVLLTEHMLKNTQDDNVRGVLLNNYLEQFRTTVFRQTMFAEFEKLIYAESEAGTPLTPELFKEKYLALNKTYFGEACVIDPEIAWECFRIPHFYNAFYVYQYATGFSAAVSIASEILKTGEVANYIEFLKSGDSDYPIELLKIAGVDLSSPEPVNKCMEAFSATLDRLEAMFK